MGFLWGRLEKKYLPCTLLAVYQVPFSHGASLLFTQEDLDWTPDMWDMKWGKASWKPWVLSTRQNNRHKGYCSSGRILKTSAISKDMKDVLGGGSSHISIQLAYRSGQKTESSWEVAACFCEFKEVVTSVLAAVPAMISSLEQILTATVLTCSNCWENSSFFMLIDTDHCLGLNTVSPRLYVEVPTHRTSDCDCI